MRELQRSSGLRIYGTRRQMGMPWFRLPPRGGPLRGRWRRRSAGRKSGATSAGWGCQMQRRLPGMKPRRACYRSIALILVCQVAAATAAELPERFRRAVQERVDAGVYPAVVIGYVADGRSEVDAFGKLDDGNAPDADTV